MQSVIAAKFILQKFSFNWTLSHLDKMPISARFLHCARSLAQLLKEVARRGGEGAGEVEQQQAAAIGEAARAAATVVHFNSIRLSSPSLNVCGPKRSERCDWRILWKCRVHLVPAEGT